LPDEPDILGAFPRRRILLALQLLLNGPQIHHFLDDLWVVKELEASPVDGFTKGSRIRMIDEDAANLGHSLERLFLAFLDGHTSELGGN
jgi:hypothetical protein